MERLRFHPVFPAAFAAVLTALPVAAQDGGNCCDAEVSMYMQQDVLPPVGPDAPQEVWGFTADGDPLPAAPNARLALDETFANALVPCDSADDGLIRTLEQSARVWVGISSNEVTNPVSGEPADGVQGWSVSVQVDGGIFPPEDQGADFITDFELEILEGSVLQERLPPGEGEGLGLGTLGLDGAEVIDPERPENMGRKGIVSFGVLSQRQPVTLPRTSSATILNVTVEPESPPDGAIVGGRVFVSDNLFGSGEAVPTIVTVDRETAEVCPAQPAEVEFLPEGGLPAGPFVRCDTNDDAAINIADAINMIEQGFRGRPAPACPASSDCNGDGTRADLSDIMSVFGFLFQGDMMPPAPFPDCGMDPALGPEDCPAGTTRCP